MATYDDLLAEYRRKHADLHKQVAERTGCSDEEIANLFDDLLYQAQQEEQQLSEFNANPQFLYNKLRHLAIQSKRLSDLFKDVSIQEQHRFCQYMRGQLPVPTPVHIDVPAAVKQALRYARKDIVHLVFMNPECGREKLIVWIQSYLDHEVQVELFTDQWETLQSSLQWHARKKTKAIEEAEDLLMQTYDKALKYIRVHRKLPEEGKMKAWLKTIMDHAHLDNVRGQDNLLIEPLLDEQIDLHPDDEDVERKVIDELGKQELARIIQLLPDDARITMELHLLQGIPLSEVADQLGEKLETVRARYKRARPLVIAHLPAKTLAEYLARVPHAYAKIQKVLQNYLPGRAAKNYKLTGLYTETEDEIRVRYVLSLHIEGYNPREIAELFLVEKNSTETEAAFAQRMADLQRNVQMCLQENLPRLFSFFYEKNR